MQTELALPAYLPPPKRRAPTPPREFKVLTLRECPSPDVPIMDNSEKAIAYCRSAIEGSPLFNKDVESVVVICLNTRKRVIGHTFVSTGTLDSVVIHHRDIFKPAFAMNAAGILLVHNHPSGDPSPSEGDIKVTRDTIRAGQLLKIEVVDHIILGAPGYGKGYTSLKEQGHFYM
jgi:DNA repair protein RadC